MAKKDFGESIKRRTLRLADTIPADPPAPIPPDPAPAPVQDARRKTKKGDVRYTVLFAPDLLARLRQASEITGLPIKTIVGDAVEAHLDNLARPDVQAKLGRSIDPRRLARHLMRYPDLGGGEADLETLRKAIKALEERQ